MSLPAPFHGQGYDDVKLRDFIFKLSNSTEIYNADGSDQKIIISAGLLDGPALTWFLNVLENNARAHVEGHNARFEGRRNPIKLRKYDPHGWLNYPFRHSALEGWDAFLRALWDKFCRPGQEHESTRENTPQSETDDEDDERKPAQALVMRA